MRTFSWLLLSWFATISAYGIAVNKNRKRLQIKGELPQITQALAIAERFAQDDAQKTVHTFSRRVAGAPETDRNLHSFSALDKFTAC
jgi:hypothetical protein